MKSKAILIIIGIILLLLLIYSFWSNKSTIVWQNANEVTISINQKPILPNQNYQFNTGQTQNIVITSKYLKPIIVKVKDSTNLDINKLQSEKAKELFESSTIYKQLSIKKIEKSTLFNSRYLVVIYKIGTINNGYIYDVSINDEGLKNVEYPEEIQKYLDENVDYE